MENLSHTLIGLAAGEMAHQYLAPESDSRSNKIRRRLFWTVSVLAGNFPDLDIVFTSLLPPPLGYLLHHRGHTHTFLLLLPQALLLWGVLALVWPKARRLISTSANTKFGFLFLLALGFLLHLGLDSLNTYGIHPFYPFENSWYFGDAVFIIEPLFWVVFGSSVAGNLQNKALRHGFPLLMLAAVAGFSQMEYMHWFSFFLLSLASLVLVSTGGMRSLMLAFFSGSLYVALILLGSGFARERVVNAIGKKVRAIDVSLSSFPSNPVCWMFVSISSDNSLDGYRIDKGVLSLAPNQFPVERCSKKFLADSFRDSSEIAQSGVYFISSNTYALQSLREAYSKNCHFRAWARFGRMPVMEGPLVWDARFQRGGRIQNFSTMDLSSFVDADCPTQVPPWTPPREALLKTP